MTEIITENLKDTRKNRMEKTILGYVPKESRAYSLHPNIRLSLYLLMGILPMFIQIPEFTIIFIIFELIIFYWANISFSNFKKFTPMFITVFFFLMLIHWLAPIKVKNDIIVFTLFGKPGYYYSLMWGFCIYLRMMSLIIASIFYFSTNREKDLLLALRTWKVPFSVSYFVGLAMRSAGTFGEDYRIIREAEKARGLNTKNLSLSGKIKHFAMYLVPLFTLSIRRSDEISTALYAKGLEFKSKIDGKKRADWIKSKNKMNKADMLVVALILIILIIGMVVAISTPYLKLENSIIYNTLYNFLAK
ncbi:energy-coupling factor transporter transmembrane component T family protein [Miniphocaeibacter halophilus]|uniref:Energy-coupling factor transporter transmembrane protein EcfT n=1 Tax=Miniphocaeibacter halophilus TaxID=2931922 RepID=A0AC61MRZ3_9FIRM|nr:energy-coupling factor transporter transmembrane component T [Miniphocaeibacter halophilus]QQK06956.1 energy-coupling factor transporter transmembrane protein EcfT [Miniphocaeibacter halophilus]